MEQINPRDIWFVEFPFEENPNEYTERPGIILSINEKDVFVLTIKVTTHNVRTNDRFDIELNEWEKEHLKYPSVARISKMQYISKDCLKFKIGTVTENDWKNILKTVKDFFNYIHSKEHFPQ